MRFKTNYLIPVEKHEIGQLRAILGELRSLTKYGPVWNSTRGRVRHSSYWAVFPKTGGVMLLLIELDSFHSYTATTCSPQRNPYQP